MRDLSTIKIAMFVIPILGAACGDDQDATAQFNRCLQYHKKKNYQEALKCYTKAAEKGHIDAESKIGILYYDIGILHHNKQDYWEALEWFIKAAEKGHTDAESKIVTYYHDELIMERNIKREQRAMLLEAQQGHALSQYIFGEIMYEAKRYEEAYYWLSLAKKKEKNLEQQHYWLPLVKKKEKNLEQREVNIDSLNTRLYKLEDLIDDHEKINDLQKLTGDGWKPKKLSGGSGFYIKKDLILTNQHVISSCNEIYVERNYLPYRVDVESQDIHVDLALLKISFPIELSLGEDLRKNPKALALAETLAEAFHNYFLPSASFRSESASLQLGEGVAVFGYPLPGHLSFEGNFTIGNVSSMEGRPTESTPSDYFQFTAPIQPGNSGGPVLDAAGNVVGIARAFLHIVEVDKDKDTLNVAQNINFAVSLKAIRKFLKDAAVEPDSVSSSDTRKEWTEIARAAQRFTVPVLCFTDK